MKGGMKMKFMDLRKRLGKKRLLVVAAAMAVALAAGFIIIRHGGIPGFSAKAPAGMQYQCSMHPQVVQDHPGICPICHMDLALVAVSPPTGYEGKGKKIVRYRNPMDPSKFSDIPIKDSMGMDYIPVYAGEDREGGGKSGGTGQAAFTLSERRQQLIGVKWRAVERRRLSRHLRLPGRVTGPNSVAAELLEIDAGAVREGMKARISGPQEQVVDADVTGVDPAFDAVTRSYAVGLQTNGDAGWLKTGVYCEVSVNIEYGERLAVPTEAIMYGGERKVVFVTDGKGRFKPVEVRLGKNGEDWVEVLSGVKEGDRVVTSSNFLIDSESRFKAALEQF